MLEKSPDILAEDELRALARQIKSIVPHSAEEVANRKYVDVVRAIVKTCSSQHLTTTHQVAAWNALSTLLDQTASHALPEIRNLLWTSDLWQQARKIFLFSYQDARPKSVKQLLVSLTTALQKTQDDPESLRAQQGTTQLLVAAILSRDGEWPVRPCMLLLSSLLRKGVVQLSEVSTIAEPSPGGTRFDELLLECMQVAATSEGASAAGQLLATLLDKADERLNENAISWVLPLVQLLRQYPDRHQALRQHLMPTLFGRDHKGFHRLVSELGYAQLVAQTSLPRHRLLSLLTTLQAGSDCGLVLVVPEGAGNAESVPLSLPINTLVPLLQHGDREVRGAGLASLIQCRSISEPVHGSILSALRQTLPCLHADTDPNFRSELFSLTQKLLDRLRSSLASTIRTQPSHDCVKNAKAYMQWYHQFLLKELRPSASYQRHISALRCLHILMRSGIDQSITVEYSSKATKSSGQWPFSITVISKDFEEVLISTLLNPFDDIRSNVSMILGLHLQSLTDREQQHRQFGEALRMIEGLMLASGRADHADTVAHLYALYQSSAASQYEALEVFDNLIVKTESMLATADKDLAHAVQAYPLHGILISLRYLFEKPQMQKILEPSTINRLSTVLHDVWAIVRPVLCNDAPEGLLPDDVVGASNVSSKAVLSYCWRALREASLLIDSILASSSVTAAAWSSGLKLSLIELTFTQLAVLRHRGAFSTVAQTWNRCCTLAEPDASLSTLFDRALALIKGTTINTRRSAGMPSIVCGILIADKSGGLLQTAFSTLEQVARQTVLPGQDDESSLPQVHAMNCIKDIVKNTKLAELSEAFVPATLQLAADSLPSSTWAVRNCGLMLFRACIDRLLGTNDSYEDTANDRSVMDFRQQAALLEQVLNLLQRDGSLHTREGVFPALQLLQHSQLPSEHRTQVYTTVISLLDDESWHVRDKAAKTLVTLMRPDELLAETSKRLAPYEHGRSHHNGLHGLLLCLKHLRRQTAVGEGMHEASTLQNEIIALRSRAQSIVSSSGCAKVLTMTYDDQQKIIDSPEKSLSNVSASLSSTQALQSLSELGELDTWLYSRATHLEARALHGTSDDTLLGDVKDWVMTCLLSMTGDSIFSTEAVANGLQPLRKIYAVLEADRSGTTELLRLATLLYDLLQDDDEDVRILACRPVVRLLDSGYQHDSEQSFEPLVASSRLLTFMTKHGKELPSFWDACVERACTFHEYGERSIYVILRERPAEEADLFAVEKQNLYIDSVSEARLWSRAAMRLDCNGGEHLGRLTSFVAAGIDELLARTAASSHGILGWSTSSDAFVLGLRVVYGAEILLHLSTRGVRLSISPLGLREKLVKLAQAAEEARLHPVWRLEFERISKVAAVSGFSAIQSLLNGVIGKLDSATPLT